MKIQSLVVENNMKNYQLQQFAMINWKNNEEKKNFDMRHSENNNLKLISYNNHNILQSYPGYLDEKTKFSKVQHYSVLWKSRKVYL